MGGLGGREPGRVGTHTRKGLGSSMAGQEVGSLPEQRKQAGKQFSGREAGSAA